MSSDTKETISIIGGGLVGCVLSLYLARRGFRIKVYESRPDPRRESSNAGRSINISIADRGWKALRDIGIEQEIRDITIPLRGRMIHRRTGELAFQPYGEQGEALYAVSRTLLGLKLLNMLSVEKNVELFFSHRCADIDLDTGRIQLERPEGEMPVITRAERIICTDGAYSVARRMIMRRTPTFQYSQQFSRYWYKELIVPTRPDGEWPLQPEALHLWPRKQCILAAFPNLERSFTVTFILPFYDETSFYSISTKEHLLAFFEENCQDLFPLIPNLVDQYFSRHINPIITIRCAPWIYKDRLALVGDSAHVFVPYLGQGLNAGLEDCTVLVECLDRHGDDWARVFEDYQALRKPNVDTVADLAEEHFVELSERIHEPRFILRKVIENKLGRLYPDQFSSLYHLITFTRLPYVEARQRGALQDTLLERFLAVPGIENIVETPEFETIARELVAQWSLTNSRA